MTFQEYLEELKYRCESWKILAEIAEKELPRLERALTRKVDEDLVRMLKD